jgi:molecular chaperone GrpE
MGSQGQHTSQGGQEDDAGKPDSKTSSFEDVTKDEVQLAAEIDTADPTSGMSHEELLLTLQDAQAKADEHWNQLLRAKADFENFKRRAERDLENAHRYGLEKVAKDLLPIKDSMELGLTAADGLGEESVKVREGIELTLKMFNSLLEKNGITEINPVGEKFNPEYHQAMTMQAAADMEPNTVLTVYQKGYLLNDRLIRPAMVVVSTADKNTD